MRGKGEGVFPKLEVEAAHRQLLYQGMFVTLNPFATNIFSSPASMVGQKPDQEANNSETVL